MKNIRYKSTIFKCGRIAGFTLVEILVSLLITAILITAVAVAFNASIRNYNDNEDVFKAINKARQALTLITTQLRTADAVATASPSNECTFISNANEDITYQFSSSENKLYMINDTGAHLLCDNVTNMAFTRNLGGGGSFVSGVQISMTVASGDVQKTLSAAVAIRKNLQ